jgi:hypothetical protein
MRTAKLGCLDVDAKRLDVECGLRNLDVSDAGCEVLECLDVQRETRSSGR